MSLRIYWFAVEVEPAVELRGGAIMRWMRDRLHYDVVELRPPGPVPIGAGVVYMPLTANTFGRAAAMSAPHRMVLLDVHAPFWDLQDLDTMGLDGQPASPEQQAQSVVEWAAHREQIFDDVRAADAILTPRQEWAERIMEYNPFVVVAPDVHDPTSGFEYQRAFGEAIWLAAERRHADWQQRWARERSPWWLRFLAALQRPITTYSIAKFMEGENRHGEDS